MEVLDAIENRISVRAYQDKPVSRETIETLLNICRWAPSGANTQPWHVAVVTGETKDRLSQAIIEAATEGIEPHPEFAHYPEKWVEPYRSRRFQCGMALYKALQIKRDEPEKRKQTWYQNFQFFGAPVGLFFLIDRHVGHGAWIDMGIFIQTIMLAARGLGLGTCPQASLTDYPNIVRRELAIDEDQIIVSGMSLGFADEAAPVNQYRTERGPVAEFYRWYD